MTIFSVSRAPHVQAGPSTKTSIQAAGQVPATIATPPTPAGDATRTAPQHCDTSASLPVSATRPLDGSEAPEVDEAVAGLSTEGQREVPEPSADTVDKWLEYFLTRLKDGSLELLLSRNTGSAVAYSHELPAALYNRINAKIKRAVVEAVTVALTEFR